MESNAGQNKEEKTCSSNGSGTAGVGGVGVNIGGQEVKEKLSKTEVTKYSFKDPVVNTYHCAFCSKPMPIPSGQVKRCGKCHKRSYCSRECQAKDWTPKPKGQGQGHKKWCGMEYGEEDIDWEVTLIKGKGRGLVAKRLIPAMFRIAVDGFRTNRNISDDVAEACATLRGRTSMANHCCKANSDKYPIIEEEWKAVVLYAKRDIEAGEEICCNYYCYNSTHSGNPTATPGLKLDTFEDLRNALKSRWNIDCPPDCLCRDDKLGKLIEDSREMDSCIIPSCVSYPSRKDAKLALFLVEQLLKNHEQMHGSQMGKARLLEMGFRIGIQQEKTLELALKRIKMASQICSSILHPDCEFAKRHENWTKDPSTHPHYLKFKKRGQSKRKITP